MPDIQICLVCKRVFDFSTGGFWNVPVEEDISFYVCSKLCAMKDALNKGNCCFINSGSIHSLTSGPSTGPLFDICKLN